MFVAPMPVQDISQVAQPQEDCAWCWQILHPSQPYPEAWSSTCCTSHSTWLINLSAERRARRAAALAPEVVA